MQEIIKKQFELKDRDAKTMPSLSLAFLGDSVYELVVRTVIISEMLRPHDMSVKKNHIVNAKTQALVLRRLLDGGYLTPEEEAVVKRGRNAHPHTVSKHASLADYHAATALECLVGWLYLRGQEDRLVYLIHAGLELPEGYAPKPDLKSLFGKLSGSDL